jgi:predicted DNA-binding transcriptional regulator AlpA
MSEPAYLTKRQLREYLGNVGDDAIGRYVRQGSLPAPRRLGKPPNGKLIWLKREVDEYLAALPPVDLARAS